MSGVFCKNRSLIHELLYPRDTTAPNLDFFNRNFASSWISGALLGYGVGVWFIVIIFVSSCARIVMSDRSGMGKSLYIQRLAKELRRRKKRKSPVAVHVTIPLHGPVVTPETLLELFQDHLERPTCSIYHIDIAPSVSYVDIVAVCM